MFNTANISASDFFLKFEGFIRTHIESLFNDIVGQLEIENNYTLSSYSIDEFASHLIDLYNTDDEKLFSFLSKVIQANNGLNDLFEEVTSYNYGIEDWLLDNPEKVADTFYENNTYGYLSDVKVYLFRTKNKICFYHDYSEEESSSYDIYNIGINLQSQIEEIINKLDEDENP